MFSRRKESSVKIIAGLGNPRSEYEFTRHNMGFMTIDKIADSVIPQKQQKKFSAHLRYVTIAGEKALLVKPLTYMNLSGQPVSAVMSWFKASLENLLVIYDDMDIETGNLKIKPQGGAGGHKGMSSIIKNVGSQEFARIRIGIGRPDTEAVNWVLGRIGAEEKKILEQTMADAAEAAKLWVSEGINKCMNKYN
ncbi:MAG: aminoacyl-tRNA hydrolase [Syntrophomonadaceae bacterium]|jgi:PTH1 family peptidyl-tRNA hydrolase|nr:aminoacyl-tRNA hydrolase [Syntrophomonadaceae bacterium]